MSKGPVWIKNIKPIKRNTKGALGFGIPDHNLKDGDIKSNHRYHLACYDLGPIDEVSEVAMDFNAAGKAGYVIVGTDQNKIILEGELDDEIDNF